jgi:hypothetical protein
MPVHEEGRGIAGTLDCLVAAKRHTRHPVKVALQRTPVPSRKVSAFYASAEIRIAVATLTALDVCRCGR